VTAGQPGHVEPVPAAEGDIAAALAALPPDALPRVFAQFEAAVAHAERTGDAAPLRHLIDSLFVTARLQRNAAYLASVAEADAADVRDEHDDEDVADFVARMRRKHSD
jgi:hypothetical protein